MAQHFSVSMPVSRDATPDPDATAPDQPVGEDRIAAWGSRWLVKGAWLPMSEPSTPRSIGGRRRPEHPLIALRARSSTDRLAFMCIALSAMSSSWTGVVLLNFPIADAFLVLGFAILGLQALLHRESRLQGRLWMWLPILASGVVLVIDVIARDADLDLTNGGGVVLRLALTMTLPAIVVFSIAPAVGRSGLRRLATFWLAGVALNSVAAYLTSVGLISVEGWVEGTTGTRGFGLSAHPNTLALVTAIGATAVVALLWSAKSRWAKAGFALAGMACLTALFLADSRAGYISMFAGLAAFIVMQLARLRHGIVWFVGLLPIAGIAAVFLPAAFSGTRLAAGAGGVAESNAGRLKLAEQAIDSFATSPVWGAGFASMAGVSVPLVLLSAGGMILAGGYAAYVIALLAISVREAKASIMARGAIAALLALAAFSLLNNGYAERSAFWIPLSFIAGLHLADTTRLSGARVHRRIA